MKTIILLTAVLASTTGFAQTKPKGKGLEPIYPSSPFSLTEEQLKKPFSEMTLKEYAQQTFIVNGWAGEQKDKMEMDMLTGFGSLLKKSAMNLYKSFSDSDDAKDEKGTTQKKRVPAGSTTAPKSGSL